MSHADKQLHDRGELKKRSGGEPRVNLRPFLFIALGLIFGIILYMRCRFGGAKGTDFIFFVLLLALSVLPLSVKRIGAILLCFALSAAAGVGLMHLKCESYLSGRPEGEYEVSGVVVSFTVGDGTSTLVLGSLKIDDRSADGKMIVSVPSEYVRAGDKVFFTASVTHSSLPRRGDSYAESLFIKDIRYFATVNENVFTVMGRGNALLRLNGAVYDLLHGHLSMAQADTAYALMTGNAGNMDDSFTTAVRQGGVAHIFAVSGLHIGIMYSAVALLFRKLRRLAPLPAIAAVIVYSAFCGFSVSSVRAVIMCAVLGIYGAIGRKYDFLGAIALAASLVLLISPAEWLSAGFRLSFGACVGLALYSQKLKRAFSKLPRFLSEYLAANLSVQLFTLPIMLDTFGYASLWGTLLNILLVPVLPVLFLGLFLAVILSLIISPAAAVFLAVPDGMLSLFSLMLSFDFSLVLSGFALGAGGAVWIGSFVLLSGRVRLKERARVYCSIFLTALFTCVLVLENAVFTGCKVIAVKGAVLIETRTERVLLMDGSLSAASYQNFLDRYYGGELDAIVIVGSNVSAGVSAALYLPADELHAFPEANLGLTETNVRFDRQFNCGALTFRYESGKKLTLLAEGSTVEIDFTGVEGLRSDLFLSGEKGVYYLKNGAVYQIN